MSLPHAVILAGGEGRRLGGVIKADLQVGGRRLLERVLDRLNGVAQPILVSTGPRALTLAMPDHCVAVPDLTVEHEGPLAGLVAALHALQQRGIENGVLVSVAVDTPFLPGDFMDRLVAEMGDAPASYAAWGEAFYPTNAAWRIGAVAEALRGGPRKANTGLKHLQAQLGARKIDWSASAALDPFANVNTLAELEEMQRRALP